MPARTADVVICGAGIAGVSAAYHLSIRHRVPRVVVVDARPPLTLTSDKSTEAYRNWWPGPDDAMVRLMNRSIDLLEELAGACDNRFLLNRRGYVYATADPARADAFRASGELAASQGAGELRIHEGRPEDPEYPAHRLTGWREAPTGADLILDRRLIRESFPYLAEDVVALLHTRRCGWFSGQQLGMEQLERARQAGVELVTGRVTSVEVDGGRVAGVRVQAADGPTSISTRCFVNAAGPMLREVGLMVGVDLPVFSELHVKMAFRDHLGLVPRDAPLLIWEDPQLLPWSNEEREHLAASEDTSRLLGQMPAGVHMRPEGFEHVIILWPYHVEEVAETFPIEPPPGYAELCVRGMTRLLPCLERYLDHLPTPFVDGGYYTKTRENRPLACPLPVEGAFVHGALSGFGLMASSGTADLLARHITGSSCPPYADGFDLRRYDRPEYLEMITAWSDQGQL